MLRAPSGKEHADDPDDGDAPSFFAEINITPLTDVMLVLLIIFMVTSGAMIEAARTGQLGVELPHSGSAAQAVEGHDPVVVSVLRDGRVAVGSEFVADDDLPTILAGRHQAEPAAALLVEADGELAHKRVVFVLDVAQKAGFLSVGVAVSPE